MNGCHPISHFRRLRTQQGSLNAFQRFGGSRRTPHLGQLVDPPKSDGVPSRILCQPIDTPVSDIVTELPDEPIDSKPESNQPSSTNLDLPASTGSEPEASLTASETEGAAGDEGLPEWEPLTPELVEDEAIRAASLDDRAKAGITGHDRYAPGGEDERPFEAGICCRFAWKRQGSWSSRSSS